MSEEKRKPKPLTNGDSLRAMSNEELTGLNICPKDFDWNFVCNFRKPCGKCLLDWLNSPAKNERLQECEIAKSQDEEESEG